MEPRKQAGFIWASRPHVPLRICRDGPLWPALTARLGRQHLLGASKVYGEAPARPGSGAGDGASVPCWIRPVESLFSGPCSLMSFLLDVDV